MFSISLIATAHRPSFCLRRFGETGYTSNNINPMSRHTRLYRDTQFATYLPLMCTTHIIKIDKEGKISLRFTFAFLKNVYDINLPSSTKSKSRDMAFFCFGGSACISKLSLYWCPTSLLIMILPVDILWNMGHVMGQNITQHCRVDRWSNIHVTVSVN